MPVDIKNPNSETNVWNLVTAEILPLEELESEDEWPDRPTKAKLILQKIMIFLSKTISQNISVFCFIKPVISSHLSHFILHKLSIGFGLLPS
mmetsp:Transcript_65439/g.75258  ORF Transcript_65439/g.75258 Transcript_65439/m.75258 type:complete len:92 (+) Transcript_65439:146-421(+)